MSDKDLVVEARELLAKATAGPWEAPHLWDASGLVDNAVRHAPRAGERWKTDTPTVCTFPRDEQPNRANAELIARAPELLPALCDEVQRLHKLIVHMHVHSGYRDNGYMQMTTEQKALYDAIWNRSVEELDREEKGISDAK